MCHSSLLICVCMHMCGFVSAYMYGYWENLNLMSDICFCPFTTLSLQQSLWLNLWVTDGVDWLSCKSPEFCIFASQLWKYRHGIPYLAFYIGAGDLSSGLHSLTTGINLVCNSQQAISLVCNYIYCKSPGALWQLREKDCAPSLSFSLSPFCLSLCLFLSPSFSASLSLPLCLLAPLFFPIWIRYGFVKKKSVQTSKYLGILQCPLGDGLSMTSKSSKERWSET